MASNNTIMKSQKNKLKRVWKEARARTANSIQRLITYWLI